jgi:hypothetical protein
MPRPLPAAVRQAIRNRSQQGQSAMQIAHELQLPIRTVRHWIRRFRVMGSRALQSAYGSSGKHRGQKHRDLRRKVVRLRKEHRRWGAGRLLVQLRRRQPDRELPSERTLQRWLRAVKAPCAPPGRPAGSRPERSTKPHEVWQMDAADQKRLANGEMISWLRSADECSGAVLKTIVFSRGILSACAARTGTKVLAEPVFRVGTSRVDSRRQRRAVGILGRSADGPGAVADRSGDRDVVESTPLPSRQRRGRTQPGLGPGLGRTAAMSHRTAISIAHRPGGSVAARGVSRDPWHVAHGRLSGIEAFRPAVQYRVGKTSLGLGSRLCGHVSLRGCAPCGLQRKDWRVSSQALHRDDPQGTRCSSSVRSRTAGVGRHRRSGQPTTPDISGLVHGQRHLPAPIDTDGAGTGQRQNLMSDS